MFDIRITGLDKLQPELTEAQRAFEALDGTIAIVRFNSNEPRECARSCPASRSCCRRQGGSVSR